MLTQRFGKPFLVALLFAAPLALLAQNPPVPTGGGAKKSSTGKAKKSKTAPTPSCGIHCGTERWAVKTLSDPAATSVNFTPADRTVAELAAVKAPYKASADTRVAPTEKQVFRVKARLMGYKQEFDPARVQEGKNPGDRDFHIVIADTQDATGTMIVEIPDPQCSGVCASAKLSQIQQARQNFAAHFPGFPPDMDFRLVQGGVEVTVTGVGLFDFSHSQTGLAKNCIELHPVLDIAFTQPGPFTSVKATPEQEKSLSTGPYKCMAGPPRPGGTGTPAPPKTSRTKKSGS